VSWGKTRWEHCQSGARWKKRLTMQPEVSWRWMTFSLHEDRPLWPLHGHLAGLPCRMVKVVHCSQGVQWHSVVLIV
jgi:hypothetical protein